VRLSGRSAIWVATISLTTAATMKTAIPGHSE
jgi:hypothetical protein